MVRTRITELLNASKLNSDLMDSEICRSRYWHSERSALPEILSIEHMAAIEDLQATRTACTCNVGAEKYVSDDQIDFT